MPSSWRSLALKAAGLALLAACGGNSTSPYGGGGGGGGGCTPTATQVCMRSTQTFSPATLTVPVGTVVTWRNEAVTHTVTSATGSADSYDSGSITSGGTFQHAFATAGTYHYYCKIHGIDGNPPTGMSGTITVQP